MLAPFHARTPTDRKAIAITISLAVAAHVVLLVIVSNQRASQLAKALPPAIQGTGGDVADNGLSVGLPMSTQWNRHHFRVLSELDGRPIPRARVTDLFARTEAYTGEDGVAVLPVRPGAKLVAHAERPGYKLVAGEYPNLNRDHEHTVILPVQAVAYARVDSIFIQRCNYCHGAVGTSGQVDLTNYDRTMASTHLNAPIVVASNPDASTLVRTLMVLTAPDGKPLPHARVTTQVPELDLATIAQWIREGARRRP